MLGHGTKHGLIGYDKLVINSSLVYLLRDKDCVCIWCNADEFVKKYKLNGFYTGMIVSELEEADMFINHKYTIEHIEQSNILFADAIRKSIDGKHMLIEAYNFYNKGESNPIINFNKENMYFSRIIE